MPDPDVTTVSAIIIADRADVREYLTARLGEMGFADVRAAEGRDASALVLACVAPSKTRAPIAPTETGEDVTAMVRQFAHDVANALNVVLTFSYLQRQTTPLEGRAHEDLQIIHDAAADAVAMVVALSQRLKARIKPAGGESS